MSYEYKLEVTFLHGTQEVNMDINGPIKEIDFSKPMRIEDEGGNIVFINLNNATTVMYKKVK